MNDLTQNTIDLFCPFGSQSLRGINCENKNDNSQMLSCCLLTSFRLLYPSIKLSVSHYFCSIYFPSFSFSKCQPALPGCIVFAWEPGGETHSIRHLSDLHSHSLSTNYSKYRNNLCVVDTVFCVESAVLQFCCCDIQKRT